MTTDEWQTVAQRVLHRREDLGLTRQQAVFNSDGAISLATWSNVEKAVNPPYRRSSLMAICRVLGWSPDSVERILNGEEPNEQIAAPTLSPTSNPVVDHELAAVKRQNLELTTRVERLEERMDRVEAGKGPVEPRDAGSAGLSSGDVERLEEAADKTGLSTDFAKQLAVEGRRGASGRDRD